MKNRWKAERMRPLLTRILIVVAAFGLREIGGEARAADQSKIQNPKSEIVLPGSPGWDSGFDGQRAWQHDAVLASDSLRGRYSGFQGSDKADAYIINHFKSLGLKEPFGKDGYRQKFNYAAGEYTAPSYFVARFSDGRADSAHLWQDYNIFKYSGFGSVKGKLIFVGYGISAPAKGWDDYAGIDVKGAIVLAMRYGPQLPGVEWHKEAMNGFKATTALEKGAIGFIACETDPPKLATIMAEYYHENMPAVWISRSIADSILKPSGKTKDEWKKLIDSTKTPHSFATNVEVEYQVSGKYYAERPTDNIGGVLPGSDPNLKRELVIIGAHMDHHGVDAAGNIYHGADDNASGSSTMMELARVFARSPIKHKRSLMFLGFAGEEEGLVGSNSFVKHLPLKDYELVAMLNMDMVGQGNCSLYVGGIADYPVLGEAMLADWPDSVLKALEFGGLYDGSDHYPFGEAGINTYVIGIKGDHPNYHTPLDVTANIKPECLKAAGDMMYHCATAMADYPEPLKPKVGKAEHLVRMGGGLEFADLDIEEGPPALLEVPGRVKGVDYPAVTRIVSLTKPEQSDYMTQMLQSDAATEFVRDMAINEGLPYMADSTRRDWRGNPFTGISASISVQDSPEGNDRKGWEIQLKASARLGVGFVEIEIPSDYFEADEEDSTQLSDAMETNRVYAEACRKAGMRAWAVQSELESTIPSRLAEIARIWGNQMIFVSQVAPREEEAVKLSGAGVFVVYSKIGDGARFKEILADPKCSKMVGIMPDTALVNTLLNTGVEEQQIEDLISGNLRATLQRWWADSSYTKVE